MERVARIQRRLLLRTTRLFGLAGCVTAAVILSVPGVVTPTTYIVLLALIAALALAHIAAERYTNLIWIGVLFVIGLTILVVIGGSSEVGRNTDNVAAVSAAGIIAAFGMGSITARLVTPRPAWPLLLGLFAVTIVTVSLVTVQTGGSLSAVGLTFVMWITIGAFALWLASSIPRLIRRVDTIGNAFNTERVASQAEAQRRQDARLLHDTALATLTLLAHSGKGVDEEALRSQARDDAHLLRSLRLGEELTPVSSGTYILQRGPEMSLDDGISTVTERFLARGLSVNVYGGGRVELEQPVREAFLLALSECLENVRRHAGVDTADVTVSSDESTVRLLVTDTGDGFDPRTVAPGRLGIAESVIARIEDVGGRARVFAAPGAGTTVILEVPQS
ncbi:sensor histidine kinase [Plantibacter sp. Mn2098]|uniref:sensor histidine kinase n=1 Tax=Plantibacter sp. Mn2098 TaxID=3395266 RepID=UPI003BBD420F